MRRKVIIPLLLLGSLCAFCDGAWPRDVELTLAQLNHRTFTPFDGAPTDVTRIAQTPDGTLWLGGRTGLTRFDGAQFVPYPGPSDEPLGGTNVSTLLAMADGGLWIAFRPTGVAFMKSGHITRYSVADGLPAGTVENFALDRDGSIWAASRTGLGHFSAGRWTTYSGQPEIKTPYWLLVDRAGTLWVAALNGLFARSPGEPQFRVIDSSLEFGTGGEALAEAPDGAVWAAPHFKLVRIDLAAQGGVNIRSFSQINTGPLLFDETGGLWGSEFSFKNLLFVSPGNLARALGSGSGSGATLNAEAHALTEAGIPSRVFTMLEDREKNIWVGTSDGLHRFSRSYAVRAAVPNCRWFGVATGAAFVAGDDGVLWQACGGPRDAYVEKIRDGVLVTHQATPPFTAAYRDHEGTIWFAGSTAIGHLEGDKVVTTPLPPQVAGRPIGAMLRERDGTLWLSRVRENLWRYHDGEWSMYGGLDRLPRTWPLPMAMDVNGVLWFGYAGSRVARVQGRDVQVFDATRGLDLGNIESILPESGVVWIGGELGVVRFDGSHFVPVLTSVEGALRGVSAIVRARDGDVWFNGTAGIVRIPAQEIAALLRSPSHRAHCEVFNYLDGVPGTATQQWPQPTAVETTDGRIWFSTTNGIVSIDPDQIVRNPLPPPVTIWSIAGGGRRYPYHGAALQLPVHTTDLQIEYSAGSLSVPERVHFRRKLEGLDRAWQDVGTRREALYTNVGPGEYTFRVTASNNDGVWNETGASMKFTILPAFYQTRLFHVFCALAGLAVLAALYRIRVRQVAMQVRSRLEARLSERERIARELHDTLLQGMQGLIWRFQAAADRLPASEPARAMLEQSLDRADQLLGESRDKVKDLRQSRGDLSEIGQALADEGEQFAQLHPAQFRVSVQGAGRELHPIVREEMLLIGREALANAFRHSGARSIEVEVTYDDAALQLRIRDDGRGISTAVLDEGGLPGHFGLVGMRERARKLGARLEVWSKPGAGTEVDLRVPAEVAYPKGRAPATASVRALTGARSTARGH